MEREKQIYQARLSMPELALADEKELQEDRDYLCALYPARAKMILVLVEDACDRLEYEGSPMFAMYPDKMTILHLSDVIYEKIRYKEADDTLLHLIQVMLCQEFYLRRLRYRKRRKYF